MDPITHGLASFALQRGFFPKVSRPVLTSMVLAGTLADLDWFTSLFGPAVYFKWGHGPLHSILAAVVLAFLVSFAIRFYAKSRGILSGVLWWLAPLCAAFLHVGMDAMLSAGAQLFWPLSPKRVSLDWAPGFDLWALGLLTAGLLLPELFRLVSDEIGAKSKKPRGQGGAILAFVLLAVYFIARGVMHTGAEAVLLGRSYAGESARRAAAFPDSTSPFLWHGVVETESAMHLLNVSTGPLTKFDPEDALLIHKPEASPMLDAAQKTEPAQQFLKFASFPKATVTRETDGYSVEIRDLKYAALGETSNAVEVNVDLNLGGQPAFAHLEWQNKPRK
jgi:membrane-bound metal-dependent hydrolase YbcI (DUF457 family)